MSLVVFSHRILFSRTDATIAGGVNSLAMRLQNTVQLNLIPMWSQSLLSAPRRLLCILHSPGGQWAAGCKIGELCCLLFCKCLYMDEVIAYETWLRIWLKCNATCAEKRRSKKSSDYLILSKAGKAQGSIPCTTIELK